MIPIDRYLDVLGVKRGVSKDDLKTAYRALIQISHPDRFQDNETLRRKAEEQTKLLNEAYRYLLAHFDEVSRPGTPAPPRPAPERGSGSQAADPTERARREEAKKRQAAEYQKRKALREAREARLSRGDGRRDRHDQQTVVLGVVFLILLIFYAIHARHQAIERGQAETATEVLELETE